MSSLCSLVRAVSDSALATGALEPLATHLHHVEDGGMAFQVRVVDALRKKPRPTGISGADPFLPGDPALVICDIPPTHRLMLNRFYVFPDHLLVVTRSFAPQDELLRLSDFRALATCLAQVEGLAFYNGGTLAGASQSHKHLQLVPLDPWSLPLVPPIAEAAGRGPVPHLPFAHALARLDEWDPERASQESFRTFEYLLETLGIPREGPLQRVPYNLLQVAARSERPGWMLLVPRSAESSLGISINALGFAGSLLVRDGIELERVRETGPLGMLASVGMPRDWRAS